MYLYFSDSSKILYADDFVAILYTCRKETRDGRCDTDGVRVFLLSRTTEIDIGVRARLHDVIRAACVDPVGLVDITGMCVVFGF
jgi:hypothetical protein